MMKHRIFKKSLILLVCCTIFFVWVFLLNDNNKSFETSVLASAPCSTTYCGANGAQWGACTADQILNVEGCCSPWFQTITCCCSGGVTKSGSRGYDYEYNVNTGGTCRNMSDNCSAVCGGSTGTWSDCNGDGVYETCGSCCTGCGCTPDACSTDTYGYIYDSCPDGVTCSSTTHSCTKVNSCGTACDGTNEKTCYKVDCTNCNPCGTDYSIVNQGFGSIDKTCVNTPTAYCSGNSAVCYCNGCSPRTCPIPLGDSSTSPNPPFYSNLILPNFRSCYNDCSIQTLGDCYEPFSTQPTETLTIYPDVANSYGFSSNTHSGEPITAKNLGNLNNPINMTATYTDYTDINGANDIEGLFVWFRDDNQTGEVASPVWLSTTSTPEAPSNSSWGFMMHREENGTWYPYIPSYEDTQPTWRKVIGYSDILRTFYINGPSSGRMVHVTISNPITESGITVTMPFRLRFSGEGISNTDIVAETKYKVLLMGLDKFSFTPVDNYDIEPDINLKLISDYWSPNQLRYKTSPTIQDYARAWFDINRTWTIDKQSPSIAFTNNTPSVSDDYKITVSWSANDTKNLYTIIGNIYATDPSNARPISIKNVTSTPGTMQVKPSFTPSGYDSSNTGKIDGDWSFKVSPDLNSNTHNGSIDIYVGENKWGSLLIYLTAFDDAGNVAGTSDAFNLQDWFVTDGGLAYSQGGTSFQTQSLDSAISWISPKRVLPPIDYQVAESLIPSQADYSTEMWANRADSLEKSSISKSYAINQYVGDNVTNYYDKLLMMYEESKDQIQNKVSVIDGTLTNPYNLQNNLTSVCGPKTSYCLIKANDVNVILNGNSVFKCDCKAIIFVSGNLKINSGIDNSDPNFDGCIFIVKGTVEINGGKNVSTPSFQYDEINAFLVSDRTITINHEIPPKAQTSIVDGVYINGGVLSRGGVIIKRSLRLIERLKYPVLAIDHHSKYGALAEVFFGYNLRLQSFETGFKP